MTMTEQEHHERHKELHRSLDELLADFITHSGLNGRFTSRPIMELLDWAHKQAKQPDHKIHS